VSAVSAVPMAEKPAQRRSLRTWIHSCAQVPRWGHCKRPAANSIYVILIFGGFMSAPSGKPKKKGLAY
jgi:hypothetical protein